ncbi:transcriptional regulator with only HTH domain, AraC family [Actinobacteria bacterium OK074]|nr:transcriptional regulator with only HTH domain, AraC family [Actinobacteria bacterium OK074]
MRLSTDVTPTGIGHLLTGYERFHTSDPTRAESELCQVTAPQRLTVRGDGSAFDAALSVAGFGSISLCLLRMGTEVTVDSPPQSRYMTVLVPLTGTIAAAHQGEEFVAVPGRTHVALSEGTSTHMRWSEDCTVVFLRVDIEALRSELAGMLPDTGVETLRFVPRVESVASRAAMLGSLHLLTSSLSTAGLAPPPAMERQLRQHTLTTVLFGLEHNYSAALRDPAPLISNRAVRHAIDVIHAEETAHLTVVDVAREVGIGLRALEIGFKKQVGMSPSQYLKKARLHRAHIELLAAGAADEATVGGIAMEWGFSHAWRFSQAYRAEFGESPSATLRRRPS